MVLVSVDSQAYPNHAIEAKASRRHGSQYLASVLALDLDDNISSLPVAAAELTLPARTAPLLRAAPVPCFHHLGLDRAAAAASAAAVVAAVVAAACC